jgi:hypothetical protein
LCSCTTIAIKSLKIATFEALHEHHCRTPLNWIEPGEKAIFVPDLIDEVEAIVRHIEDNLKAVKSCQESYANERCQPLKFEVGDHVYLRVSLMKGVKRFGMKEKLAPRYIGHFPILEKYGPMAYKLELLPSLARVHDIFHVSQLKKFLKAHVDAVLLEVTPLKADLTYPEHPIKILHQKDHVSRCKTSSKYNGATILKKMLHGKARTSSIVAIQSLSYRSEEMCDCSLFLLGPFSLVNLRSRFLLRGVGYDTLTSL